MEEHASLIKIVSIIVSTFIVCFVLWAARGYLVPDEDAHKVLSAHGFHDAEIRRTRVWFTAAGTCNGEAAQFEGTAARFHDGARIPVIVCVSWPWSDGWAAVRPGF